jgi:hypothetical protein
VIVARNLKFLLWSLRDNGAMLIEQSLQTFRFRFAGSDWIIFRDGATFHHASQVGPDESLGIAYKTVRAFVARLNEEAS